MDKLYNTGTDLSSAGMRTASFYAIIPASIRYDDRLPPNAKLLYGEISALTSRDGFCYASNAYFADLYKCSTKSVSRLISTLEGCGYISSVLVKDGSGKIIGRNIYLRVSATEEHPVDNIVHTPGQYCPGDMDKNVQSYNMCNNTERNIKAKSERNEEKTSVREQFAQWVDGQASSWYEPDRERLLASFDGFLQSRADSKKPIKSARAVTLLCNRLAQYSGGSPIIMTDMLDTAVIHGWQSVYPPDGNKPLRKQPAKEDTEWL